MRRTRRMTTTATLALAACLLISVGAPEGLAARRTGRMQRRVDLPYQGPSLAVLAPGALVGYCIPGETPGCFDVPIGPKDRYISVEVEDSAGQTVYGLLFDESGAEVADFCGSTTEPVPSPGGSYVSVWLFAGHCYGTNTPSIVTTGTVKMLFSSRL